MIVGYIDPNERVFCTECWRARAAEGSRPHQVLDSEEPNDPGDNFWLVDPCTNCGGPVKYKALTTLD